MVAILEELATDKSIDKIIVTVKQISLYVSTAEHVQQLVTDGLKEAKYISLAIDESTDTTDVLMRKFVRYFDGNDFREELPAFLPLLTSSLENWRIF